MNNLLIKDLILATCFFVGMAVITTINPIITLGVLLVAISIMYKTTT